MYRTNATVRRIGGNLDVTAYRFTYKLLAGLQGTADVTRRGCDPNVIGIKGIKLNVTRRGFQSGIFTAYNLCQFYVAAHCVRLQRFKYR